MTVENLFINVFNASEMANLMRKEVKAYYQIGEYWYVIVDK